MKARLFTLPGGQMSVKKKLQHHPESLLNISSLEQAIHELTLARDQLSKAADVAKLGIWIWTPADNSQYWNDRMFTIYQQPRELATHGLNLSHWSSRLHPEDAEKTIAALMEAAKGHGTYNPVFRIILPDGSIRYIQAGSQVEHDENGHIIRVIGFNIDITAQHEYETLLRMAKEKADAASVAKSSFLANMSHEIRTPLNAIIGLLQLLHKTETTPDQVNYLNKLDEASQLVLSILNDILDFSKIESGKLTIDLQPMNLKKVLKNIAPILSVNLKDKPIQFNFILDPKIPSWVMGDELRLQQILLNLSSNAIKFTERGEIVIHIKKLMEKSKKVMIEFSIRDTGIGITPLQCEHIFESFSQAETSTSRRYGGTGLGLAISQKLVHLLGGELLVESQIGKGSTFHFCIEFERTKPLKKPPTSPLQLTSRNLMLKDKKPALYEHSHPVKRLSELRILLVEDNPTNQMVAHDLLVSEGATVHVVDNALEAIDAIKQIRPQFDAVLMDIHMPGMDGYEASREIRKMYDSEALPIIALTAHAWSEHPIPEETSGINGSVCKPFKLDELVAMIQKFTTQKTINSTKTNTTPKIGNTSILDVSSALERFGGNHKIYYRSLAHFITDVKKQLKTLPKTITSNHETASHILHTLNGLANTLGAERFAYQARDLYHQLENQSLTEKQWSKMHASLLSEGKTVLTMAKELLKSTKPCQNTSESHTAQGEKWSVEEGVTNLLKLLESNNMEALDLFEKLQQNFKHAPKAFTKLGEAIERLEFSKAAKLCKVILKQEGL